MARPTHLTEGNGPICGSTAKSKKTQVTDNTAHVTCINCRRVLDGRERNGDSGPTRSKAEIRLTWTLQTMAKPNKHLYHEDLADDRFQDLRDAMAEVFTIATSHLRELAD